MGEDLKYNVGDKVRIKSIDWYNKNKDEDGNIDINHDFTFYADRSRYCGKVFTIVEVFDNCYAVKEDNNEYYWSDEMIEGLVEEENKVGTALNPIELKSNANCLTREMIEEFTEEENEKKLSDESWRYKNIFDSSQYPQSFELPEGYIFKDENGNVINAMKIVLEKKKKEYPKTYEECARILGFKPYHLICNKQKDAGDYVKNLSVKLECYRKLIVCRDAYWKIAGDEMGLGKPWEPTDGPYVYCIYTYKGEIFCDTPSIDCVLSFPTEEMRDAFFNAFRDDIEKCKELI